MAVACRHNAYSRQLKDRTMFKLNDEQTILQDGELDAASGGTAVEYAVSLAVAIILACTDIVPNASSRRLPSAH